MPFVNDTKPTTTYANDGENSVNAGLFMGLPFGLTYAGFPVSYSNDSEPQVNMSAVLTSSGSKYMSVSDSSVLSITGDMTLGIWYNPSVQPASGESKVLISKWNTTGSQQSFYFSHTRPGVGGNRQLSLNLSSNGSNDTRVSVNATVSNGVWTNAVVVYSASAGSATFYVNGVQVGSTQTGLPTSIFDSTADFQVSGHSGTTGMVDGLVDEVRVWNVAKSASDILASYNSEISSSSSGLQAYYKLNNNFLDSTSNANHLTNNGVIAFSTNVGFGFTYSNDSEGQ